MDGKPQYEWVGRFETKRERDAAVHEARKKLGQRREKWTCEQWVDRYLDRYERDHKLSSVDAFRSALKRFKRDFGSRRLDSVTRVEAQDWAAKVPAGVVAVVISCVNDAVDLDVLDKNPFRGLSKKGKGRSEQDPSTDEEFERLLEACDALGVGPVTVQALAC